MGAGFMSSMTHAAPATCCCPACSPAKSTSRQPESECLAKAIAIYCQPPNHIFKKKPVSPFDETPNIYEKYLLFHKMCYFHHMLKRYEMVKLK